MAELFLLKRHGVLLPASESDVEKLATLTEGVMYRAEIVKPRNYKFLQKFFVLLDVLFNIFEPPQKEYKGIPAVKNRTRFRHDITISIGYYEMVYKINGEMVAQAKSLSFASMEEVEFDGVYNKTIDFALAKIAIGENRTKEQIDNWVQQIIDFS